MRIRSIGLIIGALAVAAGCAQPAPAPAPPPDEHAAAEAAIRAADEAWAKSAADNNVDTWMSHYTDDVATFAPGEPMAVGTDAVRKSMVAFLGTPALKVSWKTAKVEAAKSGELGYSYGTYEMTFKDAKGKALSDHGKYVETWRKQADGSWKCAADIFNSDLAAPVPVK
jgi:ketosteroid isomerase-like protein